MWSGIAVSDKSSENTLDQMEMLASDGELVMLLTRV